MGALPPHAPLAGAAPQTPRFCSGIESLMGNKPVYKIKTKSKQDAEGIQNMCGVSLIGLTFIK